MSETPNLDELRTLVNQLKSLLDAPQPGLFSWCMAYGKKMQQIVDFWTQDDKTVVEK